MKNQYLNIDWHEQWKLHAPGYRDGHVPIQFPTGTLKLIPGPGFGDLSHPTTRLMLKVMQGKVKDKHVIDIGCGSGILSLSALFLGAYSAIGIDIDPDAISHSQKNAKINRLEAKASFELADDRFTCKNPFIIVMNMISSEQEVVFKSHSQLLNQSAELIVSGIINEEKEVYINKLIAMGWIVVQMKKEMGWCAFYFQHTLKSG